MSEKAELRVEPDAPRDAPDRRPDGTPPALAIEGVRIHRPPRHVDHRGSLFEAVNFDHPFWDEPIAHGEWVITSPGRIKGWGMHKESVDRYVIGQGRVRVVLYDGRLDSPTHGSFEQFHFSDESPGWLRIPSGVWHASQNYGQDDVLFLVFPTRAHSYEQRDKYRVDPHDRALIDFDWTLRDG